MRFSLAFRYHSSTALPTRPSMWLGWRSLPDKLPLFRGVASRPTFNQVKVQPLAVGCFTSQEITSASLLLPCCTHSVSRIEVLSATRADGDPYTWTGIRRPTASARIPRSRPLYPPGTWETAALQFQLHPPTSGVFESKAAHASARSLRHSLPRHGRVRARWRRVGPTNHRYGGTRRVAIPSRTRASAGGRR